ncbi:double zinc ribbon and ankyrin repeat-containing protein 1 isoform X2 [Mobula birostris]|uniref:double zinc ribbon and ankyrin repeat-containing protein 1 isoform X2 n=1 Tax=Mobula birostris TaxID=1983395 RepID=UPI003B283907
MTAGSIAVPHIIPLRVSQQGKVKHEIDTNTLIGIKSDTHDVDVYYTVNGSRPQPQKKPSHGDSSTFKYRKPFTLPAGKQTVKALAVSRDGRESGVVTKVFLVEYVQPSSVEVLEDDEENFLQDYKKELSRQETPEKLSFPSVELHPALNKESSLAWEEATQKSQELKIDGSNHHKSFKSPRFLNSPLGAQVSECEPQSHRLQLTASMDSHPPKMPSGAQAKRVLMETDFLKCVSCFAPRPSDPFARFCQECGSPVPPVPGRRLLPPEGAQGKIICRSCGTGNPANIQHCVTCETKLSESPKPFLSGDHAVPLPSQEGKLLSCSKCSRVNNTDARFCDWCGAKPAPAMSYLGCSKCGATNHPYARFCSSCGIYLEPPPRMDSRSSTLFGSGLSVPPAETTDVCASATWQPLTIPLPQFRLGSNKEDQATQTVGLFYPSHKMMEKKEMEITSQQEKQQKVTSRRPPLTAVSPGRGYWRMQLDHICAHLRSYAHNNTEFRALIGEPQMGKITSATVHEDGYELSLQLNFVLAGNKNLLTRNSAKISESNYLSSETEGRDLLYGSLTSLGSEHQSNRADTSKKPKKSWRKKEVLVKEDRLPTEDQLLLKEVGPTGLGRIAEVQQLLDEGAEPNCSNSDERPVLTVAVLNQYHEVIPVLVQKGADINQQSGRLNNTALHEAAGMGAQGVKCAAVLLSLDEGSQPKPSALYSPSQMLPYLLSSSVILCVLHWISSIRSCNANIKKKNGKGLTAYDLAVKTGSHQLTSLFAAKMGQGMLAKFTKTKHVNLDVF